MKHLNSLFTKLCLIILLALPAFLASCSDDEKDIVAPRISSLGMPNDTIVAKASGFTIEPIVNIEEPVTYSWTVNGNQVSTEKKFTFDAINTGKYEIIFTASNNAGADQMKATVTVRSYYGGFYMVNEGQYGNSGSINYYKDGEWQYKIYQANNPGKSLGNTSTTAVIGGDNMYIVSKDTPFLVKVGVNDFKYVSSIEGSGKLGDNGQGYNFCIMNESTGVLTTGVGAFKVALDPLSLGSKVVEGRCGDIFKTEKYTFMIVDNAINVYNTKDFTLAKEKIADANTGFAMAKDGLLWAANDDKLVRINPGTMAVQEITLPNKLTVHTDGYAYKPTVLQASKKENALYFHCKSFNNKEIYKYDINSATASVILTTPNPEYSSYGAGISVNPVTGDIYTFFTEDGWGAHYSNNKIVVADGITGKVKETIDYSGEYWFPSMAVFE